MAKWRPILKSKTVSGKPEKGFFESLGEFFTGFFSLFAKPFLADDFIRTFSEEAGIIEKKDKDGKSK